ncbi:hypothetical protein L1987_58451 [Smallanthus sonchifolius]|uniref:Uncharacterized protein n=1 Tax=Smallanthus sonchifolius TaxID=185202 RepID=A0ACB9DFS9_9ASTR|nr:hypothetical protein L1987_58451 [Smallanthus sonchifolius]
MGIGSGSSKCLGRFVMHPKTFLLCTENVARFIHRDQRKIVRKENPDIGNGSKVANVVSNGPNSCVDILVGNKKTSYVSEGENISYRKRIKIELSNCKLPAIVDNILLVKVMDVEMIPNILKAPTIQRPMEGDSMEPGPNEDDHRYSLVGSFQSDVKMGINVIPDPINHEESNNPFSSYSVIKELNNPEKSKVDHVIIESEHVEAVAVELVVPSHQEAINKFVVDTTAKVVNGPQETTEGPIMFPSTPPAVEDLKNRNTYFKSFTLNLDVNVCHTPPQALPGRVRQTIGIS